MDRISILLIILIAVITVSNIIAVILYLRHSRHKKLEHALFEFLESENNIRIQESSMKMQMKRVEYSRQVLSILTEEVDRFTLMSYRDIRKKHDLTMTTLEHTKSILKTLIPTVRSYITLKNIDFTMTLFTMKFCDTFIIHHTIELVEKFINTDLGRDDIRLDFGSNE